MQNAAVTCGHLLDDNGKEVCKTLELPWRDNATSISCIPAGTYAAQRRYSPEHQCDVFEIGNVPGRHDVEIHHGNTTRDTRGCVLVGTRFGMLDGVRAVLDSNVAFGRLMAGLEGRDRFALEVADADVGQGVVA